MCFLAPSSPLFSPQKDKALEGSRIHPANGSQGKGLGEERGLDLALPGNLCGGALCSSLGWSEQTQGNYFGVFLIFYDYFIFPARLDAARADATERPDPRAPGTAARHGWVRVAIRDNDSQAKNIWRFLFYIYIYIYIKMYIKLFGVFV